MGRYGTWRWGGARGCLCLVFCDPLLALASPGTPHPSRLCLSMPRLSQSCKLRFRIPVFLGDARLPRPAAPAQMRGEPIAHVAILVRDAPEPVLSEQEFPRAECGLIVYCVLAGEPVRTPVDVVGGLDLVKENEQETQRRALELLIVHDRHKRVLKHRQRATLGHHAPCGSLDKLPLFPLTPARYVCCISEARLQ